MEVHFRKNQQMKADQVEVTVEAVEANQEVADLLAYLRRYQSREASNPDASLKSPVVMADRSTSADSQEPTDQPAQSNLTEGVDHSTPSAAQATTAQSGILSVKTADEIILLKVADLILIDVEAGQLVITTTNQQVLAKERLGHFVDRMGQANFVQISKHAVINLDHLQSLSNSFSGNMTAELAGGNQALVSRRYVKTLMAHLGL
ncbi:LytTR family DNA-binding domain-containing protein [Fructobacillus evanidus]|uniref:LytR/AlgR family (LytT) n=1 Tax=Fructobacillus evanidus TaxID=3064281 RepID=A0ABN9YR06_9LACO|nr:DNA-binding response regulator [Fructobacillus sp. LMG 32999]CAK1239272.1 DNA-binding response regulator [Fructobacillus sp. LMG 32999]CAK1239519.1 DNA-binding response regulator [Fructobacillus sp. LMG 32999]CAK1244686.1 DNA-binding response regulator [Fructobacillus sp. LMG 32999]CAK1245158.1 DNA-binding response regulator [Fructobacillus sp. LMG 32999]